MKQFLYHIVSIIVAVVLVLGIINLDPTIPLPSTGPIIIEGFTHHKADAFQMSFSYEMRGELSKRFQAEGKDINDYIIVLVKDDIDKEMGFCKETETGLALPKNQSVTIQRRRFHFGSFEIEYGTPETFVKNEGGYIVTVWSESEGLSAPDEFGMQLCINKTQRLALAHR